MTSEATIGLSEDGRARLRRLTAKARAVSWDPRTVAGDPRKLKKPRFMPTRAYAAVISQFLHGEQATADLCRCLLEVIDDADIRAFLETQIADEQRHAAAYEIYLDRLGGPVPKDAAFDAALRRALDWSGPPQGLLLGFHILLEGEALRTLSDFQATWPCPVFADMNGLIRRDEARHVAFGKLYLQETLPGLSASVRSEMAFWLRALWRDASSAILADFHVPGVFTRRLRERWMADGSRQHDRTFAEIGFHEWAETDPAKPAAA